AQPDLPTYANNDGWFDDVSDGPITATVTVTDTNGAAVPVPVDPAGGAWVLCAPPDFAPRIRPVVTLYDLLFDLGVRSLQIPPGSALYDKGGPLYSMALLKADYQPNATDYQFPTYVPDFGQEVFPLLRAAYDFWWVTALVNQKHGSLIDPGLGDPS